MEFGGNAERTAGRWLLDDRLCVAFDLVPPCGLCADIGADHGKLSAALLGAGRAKHVLVADISEKALAKARRLLAYSGLSDRATFAVADGLAALDALKGQPVDAACILGMGGDTMAGVLRRGAGRLCGATLVLGAQTELPMLRQSLCDIGYRLRDEQVVEAGGRLYIVMRATPAIQGEPPYTQKELLLGPCLLKELLPGWEPVLTRRERLLVTALTAMGQSQKASQRFEAMERELAYVREALSAVRRNEGGQESRKEGEHAAHAGTDGL